MQGDSENKTAKIIALTRKKDLTSTGIVDQQGNCPAPTAPTPSSEDYRSEAGNIDAALDAIKKSGAKKKDRADLTITHTSWNEVHEWLRIARKNTPKEFWKEHLGTSRPTSAQLLSLVKYSTHYHTELTGVGNCLVIRFYSTIPIDQMLTVNIIEHSVIDVFWES